MYKIVTKYVLLFLLLLGCHSTDTADHNSIKVDIDKRTEISFFDIFERVDIIPLETNSSSLIHIINKLICYNDVFFAHDYEENKILAFDSQGQFLFKIDNRGQGPEEYLHISDFDIDRQENQIYVLDPIKNMLHIYDLSGHFLNQTELPAIVGAYGELKCLNNNKIAFWTHDFDNQLKFYDKTNHVIFQEYFPDETVGSLLSHFSIKPFSYGNYLMKSSTLDNNIYEFSSEGTYAIAYSWDFGKLNHTADLAEKLPGQITNMVEGREIMEKVRSSEIVNYLFDHIGGNQNWRYAQIQRKNKQVNLWHNIKEKQTFVFDETTEGAAFYPLCWDEEFVIGVGPYAGVPELEKTIPDAILDKVNLAKKKQIDDDANPVLLKYYFKK